MHDWFPPTVWPRSKSCCCSCSACSVNQSARSAGAAGSQSIAGAAMSTNDSCGGRWPATGKRVRRGCSEQHAPGTIFDRHGELTREAILSLLIDAPPCVLSEFQDLAQLLELVGDRLRFVCEWALELFLTPEPALDGDAHHPELAIEVLLRKLGEEVERLRELYDQWPRLSVAELRCEYRDWLCRRAMLGEREDIE